MAQCTKEGGSKFRDSAHHLLNPGHHKPLASSSSYRKRSFQVTSLWYSQEESSWEPGALFPLCSGIISNSWNHSMLLFRCFSGFNPQVRFEVTGVSYHCLRVNHSMCVAVVSYLPLGRLVWKRLSTNQNVHLLQALHVAGKDIATGLHQEKQSFLLIFMRENLVIQINIITTILLILIGQPVSLSWRSRPNKPFLVL